jgi:hypothetical protein
MQDVGSVYRAGEVLVKSSDLYAFGDRYLHRSVPYGWLAVMN